ncbi:MAG: hypothetical protein ACRD6W_13295 [Nitrososphaerales archaeon]
MATDPEPRKDPMWANREATRINLALGKLGLTDAAITKWWNHSAYEELGGRTPGQAWQREEYAQVKSLVEGFASEQFAAQLSDNPTILRRLTDSKKS